MRDLCIAFEKLYICKNRAGDHISGVEGAVCILVFVRPKLFVYFLSISSYILV